MSFRLFLGAYEEYFRTFLILFDWVYSELLDTWSVFKMHWTLIAAKKLTKLFLKPWCCNFSLNKHVSSCMNDGNPPAWLSPGGQWNCSSGLDAAFNVITKFCFYHHSDSHVYIICLHLFFFEIIFYLLLTFELCIIMQSVETVKTS